MFKRKENKIKARKKVKKNYVVYVITCLLAAFFGSAYVTTLVPLQTTTSGYSVASTATGTRAIFTIFNPDSVSSEILAGNIEAGLKKAEEKISENKYVDIRLGNVQVAYAKGALSSIINTIASGKFIIVGYQALQTATKSPSVSRIIFISLAAIILLAVAIFIRDGFKVILSRTFLESYKYDYVKLQRFLFLFRAKKFVKACITLFVTSIFQILWDLTIIGGFIKHYSYFLVRYIVAENPNINTTDAITLSRKMMNGHKWELFKTDLTFIGWWFLGQVTFGLSRILFSNPYQEWVYTSFYAYAREEALEKKITNSEQLNDIYLYEKAPEKKLKEAYAHADEFLAEEKDIKAYLRQHAGNFFQRKLGIVLKYTREEEQFNEAIEKRDKIRDYRHVLAYEQYPGRLYPLPLTHLTNRVKSVHYLRRYSIWSLVILFFSFAFVGWAWEVMLHLVQDGVFVNRGTMYGPWLPIYGFGGLLILIVLYRFRDNLGLEALSAIVLCGVLEFFAHWALELMYDTEWWNYSGYFLNIGGRICAEGLIVFMLGGMAIVYALAPMIDNLVRKMNTTILKVVCIVLLACFLVDSVYSNYYPNKGEGITDYVDVVITQVDEK